MNFTEAMTAAKTRTVFRVDVVLAELGDDDRKAALAALNNPQVPTNTLETAFSKVGHTVSYNAISRWRRARGVL